MRHILIAALTLALVAMALPAETQAQRSGETKRQFEGVGVTSKLGETVPEDITFRNAEGEAVTIGQYLDGEHPVLLNMIYHDCPMLCGLMLDGITRTLSNMSWTPGNQFKVLTVSFNHRETPEIARAQKERYVKTLGKPQAADGWHFLTGSKASIDRLTDAVGFDFRWVADKGEYAHPTVAIFLSGDGTITRYIYGMEYDAGDVRKALVEASDGKVGNPVDQIALYCFQFDPNENSYTADAFNIMKLSGGLTVVILGLALYTFWRRESKQLDEAVAAS
jgi:protein SCO1/2